MVVHGEGATAAAAGLVAGREGVIPVFTHLVVEAHKSLVAGGGKDGRGGDGTVVGGKPGGGEVLAAGDGVVKGAQLGVVHVHLVGGQAVGVTAAHAVLGGSPHGVAEKVLEGGGHKGGGGEASHDNAGAVHGGAYLVGPVKGRGRDGGEGGGGRHRDGGGGLGGGRRGLGGGGGLGRGGGHGADDNGGGDGGRDGGRRSLGGRSDSHGDGSGCGHRCLWCGCGHFGSGRRGRRSRSHWGTRSLD